MGWPVADGWFCCINLEGFLDLGDGFQNLGPFLFGLVQLALQILKKPAPQVIGVDDWTFRRRRSYGTILCDLERRCPVDLLPDRTSESLSAWLKDHPEINIISRDCASDYAQGAKQGAPQATQVAEGWHLLKNRRDALKRLADRFHGPVRTAAEIP